MQEFRNGQAVTIKQTGIKGKVISCYNSIDAAPQYQVQYFDWKGEMHYDYFYPQDIEAADIVVSDIAVGDAVVFHDSQNQPHNALVTAVWDPDCINVVFIAPAADLTDEMGRQRDYLTSLIHRDKTGAPGNYWRRTQETPLEYKQPQQI